MLILNDIAYYLTLLLKNITIPRSVKKSNIHKKSKISYGCQIYCSNIDMYSYVGEYSKIIHANIGKYCSISNGVIIGGASHPIDWVSTSPVFMKGRNIMRKNFISKDYNAYKKTIIGNDVWIGSNVLIKSGVKIGTGAIIGMGSVVTKDVPEYTIVAGSPAKILRDRFDFNTKKEILESEWWDLDSKELELISKSIDNPSEFLNKIKSLNIHTNNH